MLIKLRLHPRDFFLEYLNSIILHGLYPGELLALLLKLHFVPLLYFLFYFLHLLVVLHLHLFLIISQFFDYLIELLSVLVLGPFDIAHFLSDPLPLLSHLLVVSLDPLQLLLYLLSLDRHLLSGLPLLNTHFLDMLPHFRKSILVLRQNLAHIFILLPTRRQLCAQGVHLVDPLRELPMAIPEQLL